jgi:hypothetical protein
MPQIQTYRFNVPSKFVVQDIKAGSFAATAVATVRPMIEGSVLFVPFCG